MFMDTVFSFAIAVASSSLVAGPALGATFEVQLAVATSDAHEAAFFIEQSLSDGGYARDVSHGGVFDAESGSVKWGPLTGEENLVVHFQLIGDEGELPAAELVSPDGSGILEAEVVASADTSYSEWLLGSYPPAVATASARDLYHDGDGDGLPNFAEYHFGLDPATPNPLSDYGRFQFDPNGDAVFHVDHRPGVADFHVALQQVDLQGGGDGSEVSGTEVAKGEELVGRMYPLGDMPSFFRMVFHPFPLNGE